MVDMKEAFKQAKIEAKNKVNEMKMKVWNETPGHTKIDLMKIAAGCRGVYNNTTIPGKKFSARSGQVILMAIELAWAQHCVTIVEPTGSEFCTGESRIGFPIPEE